MKYPLNQGYENPFSVKNCMITRIKLTSFFVSSRKLFSNLNCGWFESPNIELSGKVCNFCRVRLEEDFFEPLTSLAIYRKIIFKSSQYNWKNKKKGDDGTFSRRRHDWNLNSYFLHDSDRPERYGQFSKSLDSNF